MGHCVWRQRGATALLVPGFWLLYRRMWLELVLFLGLFLVLGWVFGPSDAGQTAFGWVGLAIVVLFGERLLPNRGGQAMPADLSKHARTLIEHYRVEDGLFQLRVRSGSPCAGAPPAAIAWQDYPGLTLVSAQDGGSKIQILDPLIMASVMGRDELQSIAQEAARRLQIVLDTLVADA